MAIKMQQRRGTATQWSEADTVLAAGEIGYDTTTGEFRIGDGTNGWNNLSPFKNLEDLGGNLDDYIPLTQKASALGVATLNEDGVVPLDQLTLVTDITSGLADDIASTNTAYAAADTALSNDIATAQAAAESTANGYVSTHNSDTTNVHGISDTSALATKEGTETFKNKTISAGDNNVTINAADIVDVTASASELNILDGATLSTTELNYVDGVTSAIQTQLNGKAPLAAPALTGNATAENLTVSGNLVVNGTTTTVSSANLELTDSLIYLSSTQYDTDAVDIGVYGAYGDSNPGHFHTGLVRDASDGKWKLISAGSEPTSNVIDFSGVTYDTVKLGGVEFSDGTQVKQGVPSLTAINQQTAGYTTVLTDRDKLIEISSASGVTLTIPTNASVAYPVGTSFDILQTGAGQITIAGASGVTVNATPGLKLRTQWSSATLFKRATDTWVVYGDLSA
jgi:hypothetical protein